MRLDLLEILARFAGSVEEDEERVAGAAVGVESGGRYRRNLPSVSTVTRRSKD